jgi:hypothetical protein
MISQQLECSPYAQELLAGPDGILFCNEIEETL